MTKKTLVICESPSKIKALQKYVGDDYIVTSSMGHITEIPKTKNLCMASPNPPHNF